MADVAQRAPRRFWVGLLAIVIYLSLAALLSNFLADTLNPPDVISEFALTHFIALPVLIAGGLWFSRWSGWSHDIWRQPRVGLERPRQRWMLAIPLLMLVQALVTLSSVPWSDRSTGFVLVVAVGTLMIGLGEELYFRGILRASLRPNHGELVTLAATAALFGVAHSVGSLTHGVPVAVVAFQVGGTAMSGLYLYAAFKATGTLWVPIVLHAITDFSLYVQSGEGSAAVGDASTEAPNPVTVTVQVFLGAFTLAFIVSAALEDRRARRARRATA